MENSTDRSMQDLKPTVWIGRQGCSGTMIDEIVSQLKKRKIIKVKWLQNAEVDPAVVAEQAKARLVEVRGRTMVLAEKGKAAPAAALAKAPAPEGKRVPGNLKPSKRE
jgi:RNA-binding protein